MGRPNYTNRKIEGIKLGQAVAKDLIKRISPGLGSRAAIRDPVVELDINGKSLGNDGFAEVAAALVTSIQYNAEHGRVVKLEELCLRDNRLDISSLPALGQVVRHAAKDLRDLDVSSNLISVSTDSEAQVFEDFLRCFGECCVLRRLDLSGNKLNPKAFEILTKVYGQEEPVDPVSLANLCQKLENDEPKGCSINADSPSVEKRLKNLSVSSDLDKHTDDPNIAATDQAPSVQENARKERKTPVKASPASLQSDSPRHYQASRGLRSVPYIVLPETGMTETCALHLSYVVALHCTPEQLLQQVPPAKAGAQMQQLLNYDVDTNCQGIVYYPNVNLGSTGTKALRLAETVRWGLLDEMDEASSEASPLPARKVSSVKRTSDSWSSPTASGARRRSGTTGPIHDHEGSEMRTVTGELERVRHRIQGNALRDAGPSSNKLWGTSLQMLCVGRALCPCIGDDGPSAPNNKEDALPLVKNGPEEPVAATDPSLASIATFIPVSKPAPLAYRNPNQPLTLRLGQEWRNGKLVLTPILPSPKTPVAPAVLAPPTPPPPSSTALKETGVPYRTDLLFGLPVDVWRRIVAYAVNADGVMSEEQQGGMVDWAMHRATLAQEIESLGKPKSAQIWKVLDATGCLAHKMKI